MADVVHERIVKSLNACGDWFKKNAEDIADLLDEGCIDWDIHFSCNYSNESIPVPEINISINKYPDRELVHQILSDDSVE